MTALIIIGIGVFLLIAFGAIVGAELQDRVHEQHRRRMVARAHDLERRAENARPAQLFVTGWDDSR
jgi:hypothetical protein